MSIHRFFVPSELIVGDTVELDGSVARQVSRVLRMIPGDEVILFNGTGVEYRVRFLSVKSTRVVGQVLACGRNPSEPEVCVNVYQGLLKGDKMEMVFQKATELGVMQLVPVECRRSVPQPSHSWEQRRYPRWRRIINEAAEQSRRGQVPVLARLQNLEVALESAQGLSLMLWEGETKTGFREILQKIKPRQKAEINLFVGPEGGFTADEVALGRSHGVIPVTMGRRILRAETATLAAISVVMYELCEI